MQHYTITAGLGADPGTTSGVLNTIRGWFVGPEVKEIAKLTHLLSVGITELENRNVPKPMWEPKKAELTALANSVAALKAAFLAVMKPYVGPWWEKWKSYAINVTDATAVEAVLKQLYVQLLALARKFESVTQVETNIPKKEPEIREDVGLIDTVIGVAGWAVGLGLLWYGGRALFRVAEKRYSNPPRYATRR